MSSITSQWCMHHSSVNSAAGGALVGSGVKWRGTPDGVWSKDPYSQDRFEDSCGVYYPFQKERNIPVECNSDESHTPGTFCVKIVKQGPRGFIWDGRWRQVIRRCASIAKAGVTGVCNWGVMENGVYWEECYCSNDSCNTSTIARLAGSIFIITSVLWIFL